jgi:hypothetical protein
MPVVSMVTYGQLLLTRMRGREVAERLPRQSSLRLDFQGVDAASPSFLDELIKGAFKGGTIQIVFSNVSEPVEESLRLLQSLPWEAEGDRPLLELAK